MDVVRKYRAVKDNKKLGPWRDDRDKAVQDAIQSEQAVVINDRLYLADGCRISVRDIKKRKTSTTPPKNPRDHLWSNLRRTESITMPEIVATGYLSRATIMKHVKSGFLKGNKAWVGRRLIWLFKAEDVRSYLEKFPFNPYDKGQGWHGKVKPPSGYLTIQQVADMSGMTFNTVRKHIRSGELPAIRFSPRKANIVSETDAKAYSERKRHLSTGSFSRPVHAPENIIPTPLTRPEGQSGAFG